jgi:hypothetical protein
MRALSAKYGENLTGANDEGSSGSEGEVGTGGVCEHSPNSVGI